MNSMSTKYPTPVAIAEFSEFRMPFVDRFGQFAHTVWPEKVLDESEFAEDLRRELKTIRPAPPSWDRFGGMADGPQLEPTGSFRVEKTDGRWWIVDPDGRLFFSYGCDVLRHYTDAANGHKHPEWYEVPPSRNGWMCFTHWNLQRKFGKIDYLSDYYDFILKRMDDWGMNSIGRWGAWRLPLMERKAYLLLLDSPSKTPKIPGTHIYDVFHPEFESRFIAGVSEQKRVEAILNGISDPWCIGYSVDNEIAFESMISAMLAQDWRTSPAKNEFFSYVAAKYGDLAALNSSWGTHIPTWQALGSVSAPVPGAGFAADAESFAGIWARKYFETARKAVKALAPDKLYFSAAFAGAEQPGFVWDAACEYADVILADVHVRDVTWFRPAVSPGVSDRPILIGAFSFGSLDRGMFGAGPCPVSSQEERAESLKRFVHGALKNPYIVGCHYFQYRDQPLVGREDGEAFQIGFVDVCDRTYEEMTAASRKIGERLYDSVKKRKK